MLKRKSRRLRVGSPRSHRSRPTTNMKRAYKRCAEYMRTCAHIHTYTQPSHTQPRGRPVMPADDRPGWNKNVVVTSSISTGCRVGPYCAKQSCPRIQTQALLWNLQIDINSLVVRHQLQSAPFIPLKYIGTSSYCRYSTADRTHVC